MAKVSGKSLRSVQRIWATHGLEPHRIRTFKLAHDPQLAERLKEYAYGEDPGGRLVDLVLFGNGARHGQDRRSGFGSSLTHPA